VRRNVQDRILPRVTSARASVTARTRKRTASTCTRAFEALTVSQRIVALVVESTGIVQIVRVPQTPSACSGLAGCSLPEIFDRKMRNALLARCWRSLASGQLEEFDCRLPVFGQRREFAVTVSCVRTRPLPLFQVTLRDASKAMRLQVQKIASLPDKVLDLTDIAVWEADFQAATFRCSDSLIRMLQESGGAGQRAGSFLWRVVQGCCGKTSCSDPSRRCPHL
jgi:hypothetical protein